MSVDACGRVKRDTAQNGETETAQVQRSAPFAPTQESLLPGAPATDAERLEAEGFEAVSSVRRYKDGSEG